MDEQKILEMMKILDISRDEAIELINEDKEIDRMTVKQAESDLTEEQKKAIDKAIGEYWGMIARHSSENFLDKAKKALESAPDKIEGFIEGLIDGAATR